MLQKSLSEDEVRQKEQAQALAAKEAEIAKSAPGHWWERKPFKKLPLGGLAGQKKKTKNTNTKTKKNDLKKHFKNDDFRFFKHKAYRGGIPDIGTNKWNNTYDNEGLKDCHEGIHIPEQLAADHSDIRIQF